MISNRLPKRLLDRLLQLADEIGKPIEIIEHEAYDYLQELKTKHQEIPEFLTLTGGKLLLDRAYEQHIDIATDQIRALTKLAYQHPIAFVMTHKTYIDMLVLGLVLANHGLPIPYTFAGKNMDFFGLGPWSRRNGVIFIRRSIRDNAVYKTVLRYYIASLLEENASFMWAIEGTRSRTGKLVWPQMGILKYIMEADYAQRVKYVPVSIVYDLIPDVKEMTREGMGKKKKAESFTWMIEYLRKMNAGHLGQISVRFGEPYDAHQTRNTPVPLQANEGKRVIPATAFELVHRINQAMPVTTTSLISTVLLGTFSLSKQRLMQYVAILMQVIENQQQDGLVDRSKNLPEAVQKSLNLLVENDLLKIVGTGPNARYSIVSENYMELVYYSNMAVHHLYLRAFAELALAHIAEVKVNRELAFWQYIMKLRDLFKFEFFYSDKPTFSEQIEQVLHQMAFDWRAYFFAPSTDIKKYLEQQRFLTFPVILYNYVEAYKVVGLGLLKWDKAETFELEKMVAFCRTLAEEMHWKGGIGRLESVSKPFILNAIRYFENKGLKPNLHTDYPAAKTEALVATLDTILHHIRHYQELQDSKNTEVNGLLPLELTIPGSRTEPLVKEILEGPDGPNIGAFFDLDRTLIKSFSAKDFVVKRILSGKMTAAELAAQFGVALAYAANDKNFEKLAALAAKGLAGVNEEEFIEVGERIYLEHLAQDIIPESRALVMAHLSKGHTVSIISAATPYQVNPIARDLGIEHVRCTRLEVEQGKFTGKLVPPICWGKGKAEAADDVVAQFDLDLQKSFFYTDSYDDLPLLEHVGFPRPINPDKRLAKLAFQNGWPIYTFTHEKRPLVLGTVRTMMAVSSMLPAAASGVAYGSMNFSWQQGINNMIAAFGDWGCDMAGIELSIRGEEHLQQRPAIFMFNHQSSTDLLIAAKLIRRDTIAIAKKELENVPVLGQLMKASGVIFVDRKNRNKAISAMHPAIEKLKKGKSLVVFPEGTRSKDKRLGAFKKGAFHLAIESQTPIIPVIIQNANEALPKGETLINPAVIQVTVLPPIQTKNWQKESLNEHIESVRELFLTELGQLEIL